MSDGPTRDAYADGDVWRVFADAELRISLPDGRVVLVGVDDLPWPDPAHAVTGWNPGETRPDAENAAANERLAAELAAAGVEHHPAVGSSVDDGWEEPGFVLVGLSRAEAIEWGRRYGQLAIYEISGGRLEVVSCGDQA